MTKKSLLKHATDLVRTSHGGSYWRVLGDSHGPNGAILGAIMDIFAAGGRKEMADLPRSREVIARAGLSLRPGSIGMISNLSAQFAPPDPERPPRSVFTTIPLPGLYEPPKESDGRFRVGTLPTPLEPNVPHRPGKFVVTPSAVPSRSQPIPGTVEKRVIGGGRRQPTEYMPTQGYNDYTLGGLMTFPDDPDNFWQNEILTPQSSNVYSFAYDKKRGILYVTYRAPGEAVDVRHGTNICDGREYSYGARANVRGPMYAYGSAARPIPETLFDEMQGAVSVGKFVWDRLRVCGSVWQHQYPYALVSPSMGNQLYVPRRATQLGFRVRAVPMVGKGRRSVEWSTLAEKPYASTDPEKWSSAKSGWWQR